MRTQQPYEMVESQRLIINSLKIKIADLENKVRFQNTVIANQKEEIKLLKKEQK